MIISLYNWLHLFLLNSQRLYVQNDLHVHLFYDRVVKQYCISLFVHVFTLHMFKKWNSDCWMSPTYMCVMVCDKVAKLKEFVQCVS